MGFRFVIGFIQYFHIATTSNYNAIANVHTAVHYSTHWVFSVCYICTGCRLITASKNVASSASVFTPLLAGDCLTINLFLQLTNSQAGGRLTPNSYTSHYRLKDSLVSAAAACYIVSAQPHRKHLSHQFLYCCIA
jgi:hypothetical protein